MTHTLAFLVGLVCGWALLSVRWPWRSAEGGDRVDLTAERRTMLMHAQRRSDGGK